MSEKVGVVIRFKAQPGRAGELSRHLLASAPAGADESGTLVWTVHSSAAEPDEVWVYEVYADRAAQEAHEATPAYSAAREKTGDFLAGPPEVFPLLPLGGKGL